MSEIYLIIGMVLVTYGIRYSMFAAAGHIEFSDRLLDALRYVPPVVLTAIIIPAVLMPNNRGLEISYTNPYLVGAIVALFTGRMSKNLLLTIVMGMAAFWGWQWLMTV